MNRLFLPGRRYVNTLIANPIAGVGVLAMLLLLVITFLWSSNASAQAATLEYISGEVLVSQTGKSGESSRLLRDVRVHSGQLIKVGQGSSARLNFFDGSHVLVDAGSQIQLEQLSGSWKKTIKVVLHQEYGTTHHKVIPLRDEKSEYQVVTSGGTLSTRGGTFSVTVDESGYVRFSVDTGQVVVRQDSKEVTVSAGQAAVALASVLESDVAYQFVLAGPLQLKDPNAPTVNKVTFLVSENTLVSNNPQADDYVLVEGRILNNQLVADRIQALPGGDALAYFTGILTEQGEGTWRVGSFPVAIASSTAFIGKPEPGEALLVVFTVSPGGQWLARSIITLGEAVEPPMLAATAIYTLTPTSTPTFTPTPTPTGTQTVTQSPTATPTPSATPGAFFVRPRSQPPTATQYPGGSQGQTNPPFVPSPTAVLIPIPTLTPTPWWLATATPTPWWLATATPTPWWLPTATPTLRVPTRTPAPTRTPGPTATPTLWVPTNTPAPTRTPGPTATPTNTKTPKTPKPTKTLVPTRTPFPTIAATATPTPTLAPTYTDTPVPTDTPTDIPTATDTPMPTDTPIP